ncbi:MAG: GNAT family N-acetyltransferase [Candidatus Adiutrix sp.]|nr:GNAT family N-acetyltransferase [Candidatus Adiutrix sp.]
MPSPDLQSARIVAGALALLAREIREVGPPVDLWSPSLPPGFISEVAARVGRGEAAPLWVEERHPARGLAIYSPSPWESEFFGFGTARLLGPFMVAERQRDRENRVRKLARLAIDRALAGQARLITLKTFHDPAVLRGFLGEGFIMAEIGATLERPAPDEEAPAAVPAGFVFLGETELRPAGMAAEAATALGDFFYDGHYRHDPTPGPETACRMWRQTVLEDLTGAAAPVLALWDGRKDRLAAVATARIAANEAALSILAVTRPYRRRGLGRLILLEMLNRLRGKSAIIRAETASYNLPALRLYHSLGFVNAAPLAALHYHVHTEGLK